MPPHSIPQNLGPAQQWVGDLAVAQGLPAPPSLPEEPLVPAGEQMLTQGLGDAEGTETKSCAPRLPCQLPQFPLPFLWGSGLTVQ